MINRSVLITCYRTSLLLQNWPLRIAAYGRVNTKRSVCDYMSSGRLIVLVLYLLQIVKPILRLTAAGPLFSYLLQIVKPTLRLTAAGPLFSYLLQIVKPSLRLIVSVRQTLTCWKKYSLLGCRIRR